MKAVVYNAVGPTQIAVAFQTCAYKDVLLRWVPTILKALTCLLGGAGRYAGTAVGTGHEMALALEQIHGNRLPAAH